MPSKGNKIVGVRMPPLLLERIAQALASKNARIFDEEWTTSKWIVDACWEKLAHLSAAAKQREARRKAKSNARVFNTLSGNEDCSGDRQSRKVAVVGD
jgi:hypothetical protein